MKIYILVSAFLLTTVILNSCKKDNPIPPEEQPQINLSLEDISCTEAWIKLKFTNIILPANVTLKQNNNKVISFNLNNPDTLLYINSLLPNHTYIFQSFIYEQSGNSNYSSNLLSVTAVDTTSHNFTINELTFGEYSNSVLFDVAMIDENNIWAVGEIYVNDSLGQEDYEPYGIAHWDGTGWSLMKVNYHDYGSTKKNPGRLYTIFISDSGNIFVCSAANLLKYENNNWNEKAFFMTSVPFNGQVKKMWGIDNSNLYCVGRTGAIYHFMNSYWEEIEIGRDVDLTDITGEPGNGIIWICGYNSIGNHHSILLSGNNGLISTFWESQNMVDTQPYGLTIQCIKSFDNILFVASDNGIFRKNTRSDLPPKYLTANPIMTDRISGTGQNNVFTVGSKSIVKHFNGMTWKTIYSNYQNYSILLSAATKGDLTVAVGTKEVDVVFSKAQIILFKQN